MASVFNDAVESALARQSWFVRRKDTLTAVAGTVLQVANLAALYASDGPEWVNVVIAVVIGVAQIVVHAGTRGAITPSMAKRLAVSGDRAHLDRPSVSGVAVTTGADEVEPVEPVEVGELPVYEGEYVGQHRAED